MGLAPIFLELDNGFEKAQRIRMLFAQLLRSYLRRHPVATVLSRRNTPDPHIDMSEQPLYLWHGRLGKNHAQHI